MDAPNALPQPVPALALPMSKTPVKADSIKRQDAAHAPRVRLAPASGPKGLLLEAAQKILDAAERLVRQTANLNQPALTKDLAGLTKNAWELSALTVKLPDAAGAATLAEAERSRLRHDLRGRLTPIIGCCELWLEEDDEPAVARLRPEFEGILAASKQCLDLIDGAVGVKVEVEEDSSFDSVNHSGAIRQFVTSLNKRESGLDQGGHILVADDNESGREQLARRLQTEGHTVVTAAHGREALEMMRTCRFELVLLDMIMPVMHGFQVLEHMRADPALRDIPVIMISGISDTDVVASCIERGAEDYLSKPYNQIMLRARISASLEKKRLRDKQQVYLKQIERERKRADDLLNVILPREIAEELKATDTVKPRRYENVAILFADIVGFTPRCDARPPEEIMRQLQHLVEAWERIALAHDVEKIKTIGDAMMAASGLLKPVDNPVRNCVRCGLELIAATEKLTKGWQLRVGVHVGSVVAGKLGGRQYSFDLWGDTVNTAARMESHGVPGLITLTTDAWQSLAKECPSSRIDGAPPLGVGALQDIAVKGKGVMTVVRFKGF
jgi:adenylate cyclase